MARVNKQYFKLAKLAQTVNTPYGDVNFAEYKLVDLSTRRFEKHERFNAGVAKGDRIRIVKGRKNPIGTEGTVKWCGTNRFGYSYRDALTGETVNCNPSILLTLDDGSDVWTVGDNCINITDTGLKGILEFDSDEAVEVARKEIYTNKDYCAEVEDVWYSSTYDNRETICRVGYSIHGLCSKSFAVYKDRNKLCLKETEKEIVAVIDDFVTDTYKFVRFSKEAKHGNLLEIVDTGTRRDFNDMWRGDTGLGDALEAFEKVM